MLRLPIEEQQEPTAGSAGPGRATISLCSPKGTGEDALAGCGEDFDEDDEARLTGVLGTVRVGASHPLERPG